MAVKKTEAELEEDELIMTQAFGKDFKEGNDVSQSEDDTTTPKTPESVEDDIELYHPKKKSKKSKKSFF